MVWWRLIYPKEDYYAQVVTELRSQGDHFVGLLGRRGKSPTPRGFGEGIYQKGPCQEPPSPARPRAGNRGGRRKRRN